MTQVLIGMGSNIEPQFHLLAGLRSLREYFPGLVISPVYESEAFGFTGGHFWNLVAEFDTDLTLAEVAAILRNIEFANGRSEVAVKYSDRTLDIDLLTFGDWVGDFDGIRVPRQDITLYAFVLRPLQDLVPHSCPPLSNKNYSQLWQEFVSGTQHLWPLVADKHLVFKDFFKTV